MLTIVFDVETTGVLPKGRRTNIYHLDEIPYIIQLAAQVYEDREIVQTFSSFVLPIDVIGRQVLIPTEDFFIQNRLTQDRIEQTGLRPPAALSLFSRMVSRCDRMVAHNAGFDYPVFYGNLCRFLASTVALLPDIPTFCTMLSAKDEVAIPSKWPKPGDLYKWPSLDEAYRKLVDSAGFEGAHDAAVDCTAAARILFALEDSGIELHRVHQPVINLPVNPS